MAQEQAKEADNGTKELVENEKKEEAVVEEGTEEEDVGEMPDAAAYFSDDYDDRDVMSDRVDGIEAGGLLHGVLPQVCKDAIMPGFNTQHFACHFSSCLFMCNRGIFHIAWSLVCSCCGFFVGSVVFQITMLNSC